MKLLFMIGVAAICWIAFASCRQPNSDNHAAIQPERKRIWQNYSRPEVGEVAPPFKLKSFDNKSETSLIEFRNKKPVVLIFGSYT